MNNYLADNHFCGQGTTRSPRSFRPVIGITGNFGEKGCELAEGYYTSIERAGGIPLVIPPIASRDMALSVIERIDGLLLSGGADINPLLWGEDPIPQLGGINPLRDEHELLLTRLAYEYQLPIFGICRGIQTLCVALGGKVHQDIGACINIAAPIKHSQQAPRHLATHLVRANADSLTARLLGEEFSVNSFHHQAVKDCGPHLKPVAHSADGVIEAVESNDLRPVFAVQWHPECFITADDHRMMPLFQHFVKQSNFFRMARNLHRNILTIDSHCDTPIFLQKGASLAEDTEKTCVDFIKMRKGGLDAAVMVAYLPQGGRSEAELKEATERCQEILNVIKEQASNYYLGNVSCDVTSLYLTKQAGKHSVMLGIENGYALGKDLSNIERFRREGVIYVTLCHNGDNDLCDSAMRSKHEHGGLSEFGRAAVAEMNRCGMMIDLSHASEETFYQVLELSKVPVICSHSSAHALCNHPRNLTDDQIRAIAAKGGVVQVTFYNHFLVEQGEATIDDAVRHILHVIEVAGIDSVGIGSDFDGDGGVRGLRNASCYLNLTRKLLESGLTGKQLKQLWGGNFARVMSTVQRCAEISFNSNSETNKTNEK